MVAVMAHRPTDQHAWHDDVPIGRAAAGLPASTQRGGWAPGEPVTAAETTSRSRLGTPTVDLADVAARLNVVAV